MLYKHSDMSVTGSLVHVYRAIIIIIVLIGCGWRVWLQYKESRTQSKDTQPWHFILLSS